MLVYTVVKFLVLTCSDFAFDNVHFDLRKCFGFKYILPILSI